jgi:hypothetical protein
MTTANLENIAGRIDAVSKTLRAVIAAMQAVGAETLEIKNRDTLTKAMAGLESYGKASWDALHEHREHKGDYGPVNGQAPKKAAKKKLPKT